MQYVEYHEQSRTVLWGSHATDKLLEVVQKLGGTRVMIVTGQSIRAGESYEKITASLGNSLVGIFDHVKAHVPQDSVEAAVELARSLEADTLVSVGGGSAIDTAKAINMVLTEGDDYSRLRQKIDEQDEVVTPPMPHKKLLHIAIPTTLSAAECTGIVGITMTNEGEKHLFSNPCLAPQSIIYDPVASLATPEELWFSTALRALDHAIERSYSLATNPLNDAMCSHAIKLIFSWLPKNMETRNDEQSRLMLMHAAFLSMAGPSTTCLSHAIGHQLGPRYKNPRFDATAVTQPAVMAFNRSHSASKQKDMAVAMGVDVAGLTDDEAAKLAEKAVRQLIAGLTDGGINIPTRLRDTGISEREIEQIVDAVWRSPRLKVNPRPIKSKDELTELLQAMW